MLRVFVPGPFDREQVVAAVRDGSLRRLRALVGTHGPLAVRLEDGGRAAIHLAAAAGDAVVVGYLLGLGADPGAATADGETPVHVAASEGHTAVVERLTEAGARVNPACTTHGWTPLHLAAARGHARTAQVLLALGADPDARDLAGRSPARVAWQGGHHALAATCWLASFAGD